MIAEFSFAAIAVSIGASAAFGALVARVSPSIPDRLRNTIAAFLPSVALLGPTIVREDRVVLENGAIGVVVALLVVGYGAAALAGRKWSKRSSPSLPG